MKLYLPDNLVVTIKIEYNLDNIEFTYHFNKNTKLLDHDSLLDGHTVHKNFLTIKLSKYLQLTNLDKNMILKTINYYINLNDELLAPMLDCFTKPENYKNKLLLFKKTVNSNKNLHLAIINFLEMIWI